MVGIWYQCHNVEEVAKQVGADQTTVRRNLRKAGIDTAPRALTAADVQEIGQLADQGLSCRQIGARVDWTHGTVAKAIRLYRSDMVERAPQRAPGVSRIETTEDR